MIDFCDDLVTLLSGVTPTPPVGSAFQIRRVTVPIKQLEETKDVVIEVYPWTVSFERTERAAWTEQQTAAILFRYRGGAKTTAQRQADEDAFYNAVRAFHEALKQEPSIASIDERDAYERDYYVDTGGGMAIRSDVTRWIIQ